MHTAMDALGMRPAAETGRRRVGLAFIGPTLSGAFRLYRARMRSGGVGLRSVPSKTGVVGHRILILGAGRIVFGHGAPGRRQGGQAKRNCCGARGQAPQLRSAAPVRLETSATIFDIAASISASVRVRSRGCSITWMAIDFEPSGTPSP